MSYWRDLSMFNALRSPQIRIIPVAMLHALSAPVVGNMRILIRIRIRILPVVQSADPQSADPHFTRSLD